MVLLIHARERDANGGPFLYVWSGMYTHSRSDSKETFRYQAQVRGTFPRIRTGRRVRPFAHMTAMRRRVPLLLFLALSACGQILGAEFFAAPGGRSSGTGSEVDPWDLATALSHPRSVSPGDTIWLRAGTYKGFFISRLSGAARAPITVRAYRDERVILDRDGQDSQNRSALTVMGSHTWYWGFEITNSSTSRVFANSFRDCPEHQHCRPAAVMVLGPGVKLINLVIHDTGDGIGLWASAVDAEVYGNIVFYTGWQSENRGSGHALYAQNNIGTKRIIDNILFSGFHSGVHFYGSSDASLKNFYMEGNTIFNTGLLADDPSGWGILVGGGVRAENVSITRNYLYNPDWYSRSNNLNPSYGSGSTGIVLEDNYSAGFKALGSDLPVTALRATGNVFAGSIDPPVLGQIQQSPGNSLSSFASMRGATNRVFIRKNRYEPHKATVTVFNWKATNEVALDLSSFLKEGDSYEVIDVQNFFGGPVKTGRYDGSPVTVPMNSGSGTPIGDAPGKRYRTSSEFGVFQVRIRMAESQLPRQLRASAPVLTFSRQKNVAAQEHQVLSLSSLSGSEISWEATASESWLQLSQTSGSAPARIRVMIAPGEFETGTYAADIRLSTQDGEPQIVPVTLRVLDETDSPVIDSVVNSASLHPEISGSLLLTIQGANLSLDSIEAPFGGALPTELGGTKVLIAGVPAYLRAVSPSRVLVLPPALPSLSAEAEAEPVDIVVETAHGVAFTTVDRLPVAVGVFELGNAQGHIAATHIDGSLVAQEETVEGAPARPARQGEHIALYLSGLTASAYQTGEQIPSPITADGEVEVILGGTQAMVTYAGLTSPGFGQVNVIVPDLPEGQQSVVLKYNGAESQPSAYLPIVH